MAMISLVEDYNLVGFETLAVEVRISFCSYPQDPLIHVYI
jgi:hypothetical protein